MAMVDGELLGVIVLGWLMWPSSGGGWGKCWCSVVEEGHELGSLCYELLLLTTEFAKELAFCCGE